VLTLRAAVHSDMELLFEWANDTVVRSNSFSQERISFEEHKRWFLNKMSSADTRMFIAAERGKPVGIIRFERENIEDAVVSITVSPEWRGKGFGKKMLNLGIMQVKKNGFAKRLYANIKPENTVSRSIFVHNGFRQLPAGKDVSRTTFMLVIDSRDGDYGGL
jgi:RimJ/RimL family protein N-acetyltransferase